MNMFAEIPVHSLQPFAPDPDEAYPIDTIAHLADVPRHLVLLCCRHNLIAPEVAPESGGYRFTADAIRMLRRADLSPSRLRHQFRWDPDDLWLDGGGRAVAKQAG